MPAVVPYGSKMAAPYRDVFASHHEWPATVMAVDCTGSHVVLGARKGLAFINLDSPSVITKKVNRDSIKWDCGAVEWNPHISQAHILAAVSNQKAEIWKWRDGSGVQTQMLRAHTRIISDLNWSWFDPQVLSTCSVDQFVYIWDLREKKPATSLQAVVGASQVKWNKEDRNVLATSHDGDVRIWDLRKGNTPVVYITAHLSKIHGVDWSRTSGTALATCSNDASVKLWNTENPRQPEAKLTVTAPVWRARYTPFGHGVLTVVVPQLRRGENNLCLWNAIDLTTPVPTPVHTFEGHNDVVLDFHWRSQLFEGEEHFQLVTWSKDQNLRLWAVEPKIVAACSDEAHQEENHSSSEKLLWEGRRGSHEGPQDKRTAGAQPQTLQQEFALINVNIHNVTVEQMDAGQRCCTVSVTNGSRVTLSIHFPAMYPNNAIPGFVFTPDTAIPMSTQSRLIKTLQETAYNHVKLNQTCLEPCLRQLVSQLEELTLQEERVTDVSQAIPQILPVTYGSYQDAAIPFPRTSGAKFSACGLLVCFHRPNASNEPTPRSLSALSAYSYRPSPGPALPPLHNNTGNLKASHPRTFASFGRMGGHSRQRYFRSLSQEDRMSKKFGSMSAPAPRNRGGLVMIWDVSVLMPLHRSLAQNYVLEGNDVIDICKKNTSAALAVGRKDLVQTWSLLGLVLERKLAQAPDNVDDTPWALHPFGRPLLDSLMEYYLNIRDIQTLAVLTCVMSHHSLPDSFKPAKHQGHLITSKSFTFGSTMGPSPTFMYETSHQPGPKRSKSVANSSMGLTGEGSTPEMVWCDILPHDSWTPPEFINKRDAMEEQRKQHDNNCRLLVQSKVLLHDHFKRVYADVLYRWNLLSKRAEVLKFLSKPPDPHKGVEFSTRCYNCLQRTRGAQCMSCKSIGLQCSICHVAVRGASNFCIACGHGGHANHMIKWFEAMDICPTGCGCQCLKDSILYWTNT